MERRRAERLVIGDWPTALPMTSAAGVASPGSRTARSQGELSLPGRGGPLRESPNLPDRLAPRIGVIHNARARHNVGRRLPRVIAGCDHVMPTTHAELRSVLTDFVAAGVDTLVVDGGDGTVRDIISVLVRDLPGYRPPISIVPTGKTNALALDLGIRRDWTLAQAVEAVPRARTEGRAPIEVWRDGEPRPDLAGFIIGAGAFVRATGTAQGTHRLGAFNGLAVGLSIAAGVAQTIFGGRNNAWRQGERMRIVVDAEGAVDAPHYMLLASTLTRLPLGVRPLGRLRPGLKMLRIEAPVRRLGLIAPIILAGGDGEWLRSLGYHHRDAHRIDVSLAGSLVLDGEVFDGGDLSLRLGAPLPFLAP